MNPEIVKHSGTNIAVTVVLLFLGLIVAYCLGMLAILSLIALGDVKPGAIAMFGWYVSFMGPGILWVAGAVWAVVRLTKSQTAWLISLLTLPAEILATVAGYVLIVISTG